MLRVGAIVRLLMMAACLVPFTSTRQAETALAPIVPVSPAGPVNEAPAPVNEDDERETDGKERFTAQARHRTAVREPNNPGLQVHAAHTSRLYSVRTTPPVAVDPFRNGLGSPYRC